MGTLGQDIRFALRNLRKSPSLLLAHGCCQSYWIVVGKSVSEGSPGRVEEVLSIEGRRLCACRWVRWAFQPHK